MAPSHSKPIGNGRNKKRALNFGVMDSAMSKVAKGTAVFSDEFVEWMATSKDVKLPKNLDDIIEGVEKENSPVTPKVSKKVAFAQSIMPLPLFSRFLMMSLGILTRKM